MELRFAVPQSGDTKEPRTAPHPEAALVLTPPETASEEDDGLLTASDVVALKLDADWVVLSACNTAAPGAETGTEALSGRKSDGPRPCGLPCPPSSPREAGKRARPIGRLSSWSAKEAPRNSSAMASPVDSVIPLAAKIPLARGNLPFSGDFRRGAFPGKVACG